MPESVHEKAFDEFLSSVLPLYSSPQVTVRIISADHEYKLSKALLCTQSTYFKATFEGKFQEGVEQSTTIADESGAVSVRGFELLIQWMYLGRVVFGDLSPDDTISAIVDFVRIADMCGVTGMEVSMAKQIKATILTNSGCLTPPHVESNTFFLNSDHIGSAACLPDQHPVRTMMATAAVKGFLLGEKHKFSREEKEVPNFTYDLLKAAKDAIKNTRVKNYSAVIADPLSGEDICLGR